MKRERFFILACAFLLTVNCTGRAEQKGVKPSEPSSQPQVFNRSEGRKIIRALSKAYGDDSTMTGDFVGSTRCPSFLEGRYFEGNTLVLQVRGDTLRAREILETVSGSKAFRIEMMTDSIFSEKQLQTLLDELNRRYNALPKGKLKANMVSWGRTAHLINVTLVHNTPEARAEFCRLLMDSPTIRFSGPENPVRNNTTGVSEAYGICLYPEYTVYPDTTSTASFILLNGSDRQITCGMHYFITYEGTDKQWYELPINTFAVDIAYLVSPESSHRFVANLHSDVNDNHSGRYRFFYGVWLESGENIQMMAEFRLTDNYEKVKQAEKTPIPKITGKNYVELPKRDAVVQASEEQVFGIVEEMPEFPGGMPALMEFIRKNLRHDKAEKKERVIIQIVVDKEGNATNPMVLRSVAPMLDEQALRIVSLMPKWKPGRQAGKNRNVKFVFPVVFEPSVRNTN